MWKIIKFVLIGVVVVGTGFLLWIALMAVFGFSDQPFTKEAVLVQGSGSAFIIVIEKAIRSA